MRHALYLVLCALCLVQTASAEGPTRTLSVTSEPRGAAVFVDGRDCDATPTDVPGLAPGRHRLSCRLAGYEDYDRFVTLNEARTTAHHAELKPVKGLLLVRSEPEGCNIVIDGISFGATPRLITTLDARDPHTVTLRKAGYSPTVFEVRFAGRTPVVRNEKMVLDSGVLDIVTEPAGAEIMVNGNVRGVSPVTVRDVPKGRASVRVRLDGYEEELRELAVNANETQTLSVTLKGLPGTLGLTSLPTGARFYVNGEFVGKSPVTLARLKPGDYEVRAEIEGYAPLARTVTIANGASAREEFRLANIMGRLEVRSSPAGAEITMDGRFVGTTKTNEGDAEFSDILAIENLMEGEHVLTVKAKGHAESVRHPKIRSGKTSVANVRLKRVFTPDVRIKTESGTYDGVLIKNTPDFVTVEVKLGIQRSFKHGEILKMTFLSDEKK